MSRRLPRHATAGATEETAMVGAMRLATIGVSNMQRALGLFRDLMELKVERSGPVPLSLLKAWRLPPGTAVRMVELSSKGYAAGRLRLVEFQPTPTQAVRLDFGSDAADGAADVGPKSLDFYVAGPIQTVMRRIEMAGLKFRGRAVKHELAGGLSEDAVFAGPDGVPLHIMASQRAAAALQRAAPDGAFSEAVSATIVVADLAKSKAFYGKTLGLKAVSDADTPDPYRTLVNDLAGTPRTARVRVVIYAAKGEASGKIKLMHFYERTGRRLTDRMKPGRLGFSLMSHEAKDLEALQVKLRAAGAKVLTPPTLITGDGSPYRVMLVKGLNEEMFEFTAPVTLPVGRGGIAAVEKAAKVAAKKKTTAKIKIKTKR